MQENLCAELWREARRIADEGGFAQSVAPSDPLVLAPMLDSTLLAPDLVPDQVVTFCAEARRAGFGAVCLPPVWVPLAARCLQGSSTRVCTVVGFPLGATSPGAKAEEARIAVAEGAAEIDMVLSVGHLKAGLGGVVRADIEAVRKTCPGAILKVILETALLEPAEVARGVRIAAEAGADFVKTSTGFLPKPSALSQVGATPEVVAFMRLVSSEIRIKASGGIGTYRAAALMIRCGATRIGTSRAPAIIREALGARAGARTETR
jgi:deoxyribose-phosphate aldolase